MECPVVFVHGFLDDHHVWNAVVEAMEVADFEPVALDLPGCGERARSDGPFTYPRYAADVGAVVDELDKPVVLVGHGMGAPIAELVAATHPQQTLGLMLIAPIPLGGAHLPDAELERFRALAGDATAQRAVRRRLSAHLSEVELDRLVAVGLTARPDAMRGMVECWNSGLPGAPARSDYTGPVLILRCAGDAFVTEEVVSAAVAPRFRRAEVVTLDDAGHWPHVERPAAVAEQTDRFVGRILADGPRRWRDAFAHKSADEFGAAFADDVVLEASTLVRPIEGRERVKRALVTASEIYESLTFTHEASAGTRTYMEWEVSAFDGVVMKGVTILTKDERGLIIHAAVHHRPLAAALRFSAELRERLHGLVDPDHFYSGA